MSLHMRNERISLGLDVLLCGRSQSTEMDFVHAKRVLHVVVVVVGRSQHNARDGTAGCLVRLGEMCLEGGWVK